MASYVLMNDNNNQKPRRYLNKMKGLNEKNVACQQFAVNNMQLAIVLDHNEVVINFHRNL